MEDLAVVVSDAVFEAGEILFGRPDVAFAFCGIWDAAVEFDVISVAAIGVEGGFVALQEVSKLITEGFKTNGERLG